MSDGDAEDFIHNITDGRVSPRFLECLTVLDDESSPALPPLKSDLYEPDPPTTHKLEGPEQVEVKPEPQEEQRQAEPASTSSGPSKRKRPVMPYCSTSSLFRWSPEAQGLLVDGLKRIPLGATGSLQRYVLLAAGIPGKSVRDVALRIKWMESRRQAPRTSSSDASAEMEAPRRNKQPRTQLPEAQAQALAQAAGIPPAQRQALQTAQLLQAQARHEQLLRLQQQQQASRFPSPLPPSPSIVPSPSNRVGMSLHPGIPGGGMPGGGIPGGGIPGGGIPGGGIPGGGIPGGAMQPGMGMPKPFSPVQSLEQSMTRVFDYNSQLVAQVQANIRAGRVEENMMLLGKLRENLHSIMPLIDLTPPPFRRAS